MKKLPVAVIVFLISFSLSAQETENENHKNELGIEFTTFVRSLLPYEQGLSQFPLQPFFLTYKRHFGNSALRLGAGGNLTILQDTGGYNTQRNYTDRRHGANLRIGWEFQQLLSRKLKVYYGADIVGGYGFSVAHHLSSQHGTPDWITTTTSFGAGPILGIQWWLTPRISFATESSFYISRINSESEFRYVNTPENNKYTLRRTIQGNFAPPLFIYFTFRI
ncbi:MAG: hypothetical protein H0X62_07570 [Bacteroidetes bacterium]|nr:hypothetical protein [Bacteroidota bacterium]